MGRTCLDDMEAVETVEAGHLRRLALTCADCWCREGSGGRRGIMAGGIEQAGRARQRRQHRQRGYGRV